MPVAAFDEAVDTTDWIVQRVDVYYELLHDCRRKAFASMTGMAAYGRVIDNDCVLCRATA